MIFQLEREEPFTLSYLSVEEDRNSNGFVHGGVIFHLCDEAVGRCVVASGRGGAASDASIHYYRPARIGERLTAAVQPRKLGRRLGVYLVDVRDPQDRLMADGLFTIAFSEP